MSINDNTSAQVSAWITEYNIDNKYWEDNPDKQVFNSPTVPYEEGFSIDRIRILDPSFVTKPFLDTKVVVLQKWTDHTHLIAPISRLHHPAVRGELLLPEGKVIEVWNAKIVPDTLIAKGWNVSFGTIPEKDGINCRDLFRHLTTNTPLMKSFSGITGPKLSSVSDPRYKWMIDERQRWKPLDTLIQEELIKLYNA